MPAVLSIAFLGLAYIATAIVGVAVVIHLFVGGKHG